VTRARLAPAKVNLFLHVGPLQADGYHPLASWMVFADVGDELRLEPAPSWSFEARGPFAPNLGDGENLVEAAARKLFERADIAAPPLKLVLDKRLPVAAGLGGGSSDAGAALRLLDAELPTPLATTDLTAIAAELGADGPACLQAASVVALGRGDRLQPAPRMAPLPAVLVNPRKPSFTGAVYRAYDGGAPAEADLPAMPEAFAAPAEVAAWLGARRNDLEAPGPVAGAGDRRRARVAPDPAGDPVRPHVRVRGNLLRPLPRGARSRKLGRPSRGRQTGVVGRQLPSRVITKP
jgi:4-diphosphocytidyl-2-C-methyl-D-erythritol kinase